MIAAEAEKIAARKRLLPGRGVTAIQRKIL